MYLNNERLADKFRIDQQYFQPKCFYDSVILFFSCETEKYDSSVVNATVASVLIQMAPWQSGKGYSPAPFQ